MKKTLGIIGFIVIILIIGVIGIFGSSLYKNKKNSGIHQNETAVKKYDYPELTSDVIEEIGGQDIADKLIGKFEKSANDLDEAIKKYEAGGRKEIDKPSVILFVEAGKYAKYVRKYDLAVETLESVFDYYDESNIALINLAHVYEDMDEYQKAINTYLRFYEMFPGDNQFQFHVNIMHDYMALDNKEKVIEYYEQYKKAGFTDEEMKQYISEF